nr:hypothetical protein [Micromonospora sp. DSM 115978]
MPHTMFRRAAPLALMGILTLASTTSCGGTEQTADVAAPPAADQTGPLTAEPAGEPTSAPARSIVDPCALISAAEAEQLAGTPLDDPVPAPQACTHTGPATGPTAQVEVYVGDGAKKQLDIERELGHDLRPVSGAGDEAYIYVDGAMIFVNRSGLWFSIRLVLLDDPVEYRESLEALARTAAGRI